ncbi:MAG: DUF1294 domain-containing protein [Candidatus Methanogranum gryphiswaldense]|nr:MAG: DUF1294 domain-containing protein [Candidatus Methanogranum sp. U3.2.1]
METFSTGFLVLLVVYLVICMIAFALYGIDKRRAIKDQWRISEATLLTVSFFGAIGAVAGMKTFRHKTQKLKFKVVYLFLVLNIVLLAYAFIKI